MDIDVKEYEKHVSTLYSDLGRVMYFSGESAKVDFLVSSLIDNSPASQYEEIEQWLIGINIEQLFEVRQIPLPELNKWSINPTRGDICHDSGGFFSVRGLKVQTNVGPVAEWTQPIIDQPEIGVLGIVTKKINGVLHFLMQAKAEPGNINTYQISPTVQATRSNFTGVHGGKSIPYIDYFLHEGKANVIVDQLQSEQGSRFYRKRNRNVIVRVGDNEDIELKNNYRWITLGQIKSLLLKNNLVNMDARSVISSISYIPDKIDAMQEVNKGHLIECLRTNKLVSNRIDAFEVSALHSCHYNSPSINSIDQIIHKIAKTKFATRLNAELIPLNTIKDWVITQDEIFHKDRRYFTVIGVRIRADGREVLEWDQPIVRQKDPGIVGFVTKEFNGVLHFLVQFKVESGNLDVVELAPTVQCITDSYEGSKMPHYTKKVLALSDQYIERDSFQSEEGGRFFREENRNIIVYLDEKVNVEDSDSYVWMTLKQLKNFVRYNNYLNVESRSLLSLV